VSQTASYHTTVEWTGAHSGRIYMGNGPEMQFSAPPDTQGLPGVLTPEDAFVAAVNTCVMLMFLWSCERLKINLLAYECQAEGTKLIELDHTEIFSTVRLVPVIQVKAAGEAPASIEARIQRALKSAQKYSLVANSIKSELVIDPVISVIQ
jgi:organic hydroperoxide reductase OsmC/OhrA